MASVHTNTDKLLREHRGKKGIIMPEGVKEIFTKGRHFEVGLGFQNE